MDNVNSCGNFLMVYYETPEFIKDIWEKIEDDEIYFGTHDNKKGIEKETHVTLLACIPEDVTADEIKSQLENKNKYFCLPYNISEFNNDEYDVLKCDVFSNELVKTNSLLVKKFGSNSEYTDYKPHMTIAYLKKGEAKKYCKDMLDKMEILYPKKIVFSFGKDDKKITITG